MFNATDGVDPGTFSITAMQQAGRKMVITGIMPGVRDANGNPAPQFGYIDATGEQGKMDGYYAFPPGLAIDGTVLSLTTNSSTAPSSVTPDLYLTGRFQNVVTFPGNVNVLPVANIVRVQPDYSPSVSPSATASASWTPSITPSNSAQASRSASTSASVSASPSVSGAASASPSVSGAASASPTVSWSVSPSASQSTAPSPSLIAAVAPAAAAPAPSSSLPMDTVYVAIITAAITSIVTVLVTCCTYFFCKGLCGSKASRASGRASGGEDEDATLVIMPSSAPSTPTPGSPAVTVVPISRSQSAKKVTVARKTPAAAQHKTVKIELPPEKTQEL